MYLHIFCPFSGALEMHPPWHMQRSMRHSDGDEGSQVLVIDVVVDLVVVSEGRPSHNVAVPREWQHGSVPK